MVAVGLWAALKGGRALWLWPAAFVGVMLVGAAFGMAHVPGTVGGAAFSLGGRARAHGGARRRPAVWTGAAIVAVFALLHGHAHGTEVAETVSGAEYMAGFALATATLHGVGIVCATNDAGTVAPARRIAGAVCVMIGAGLWSGVLA